MIYGTMISDSVVELESGEKITIFNWNYSHLVGKKVISFYSSLDDKWVLTSLEVNNGSYN